MFEWSRFGRQVRLNNGTFKIKAEVLRKSTSGAGLVRDGESRISSLPNASRLFTYVPQFGLYSTPQLVLSGWKLFQVKLKKIKKVEFRLNYFLN